jgi:hypothetical protein
MMFQPVTTPVAIPFVWGALNDGWITKQSVRSANSRWRLIGIRAEQNQWLTEFLHYAMRTYLPQQYGERSRLHDNELEDVSSSNKVIFYLLKLI